MEREREEKHLVAAGSVETVRACGGYKGTSGYAIDWNAWTESRMDNFGDTCVGHTTGDRDGNIEYETSHD
jgi:hypothetical protein